MVIQEEGKYVQTRCAFCGRKEDVPAGHKDYEKIRLHQKIVYICTHCNNKVRHDADESLKPKKPVG
jgi:RNase P subunit RPR2